MTGPTPTEGEDFGYALTMSSPASLWKAGALPRPQLVSRIDTWMNKLRFSQSVLIILVGVWGLAHQGFKGTAQMAKVGMSTTFKSSDDTDQTDHAGR